MIMLMRYLFAVLILTSLSLAQTPPAPSSTPAPAEKSAKPTTGSKLAKGAQARPDDGSIAGDVYTEKFFNLSCTIPQGWVVKTAAMREGLPAEQDSMLLLSAFAKDVPVAGEVNSSLTITAENQIAYPQVKTTTDYFSALSEIVTGKGFTVLNEPAEIEIGGVTFLRGDFQKEEADGTTYQATMVAIRNGYILAVTAISGKDEDLTPLLNRVHVIAPPSLKKK